MYFFLLLRFPLGAFSVVCFSCRIPFGCCFALSIEIDSIAPVSSLAHGRVQCILILLYFSFVNLWKDQYKLFHEEWSIWLLLGEFIVISFLFLDRSLRSLLGSLSVVLFLSGLSLWILFGAFSVNSFHRTGLLTCSWKSSVFIDSLKLLFC